MPVVGFLHGGAPTAWAPFVTAFENALKEAGYVAGVNVRIEYRWSNGQNDQLPALAAELVRRQVSLIVATPGVAALAAKPLTTTIPIVFQVGGDPVKLGLVASLNRPGGNLTGVSQLAVALAAKRLDLLHSLAPKAKIIALLADPKSPTIAEQLTDFQQAVRALGLRPLVLSDRDIDSVFKRLIQEKDVALVVNPSGYLVDRRNQVITLAAHYKIPAIYEIREFAVDGGLMSYGTNISDVYRLLGVYSGKLLKGAKPPDLPVQQPTKFELIINLKTAKELGLDVPPTLLSLADEVIE